MKKDDQFNTTIICLEDLEQVAFSIPTYQRPYVWGEEQITKLLSDCAEAFLSYNGNPYFLGTILTNGETHHYELIDGQQRFTTMWLIAAAFKIKGINSKIVRFLKNGTSLRIDFEIRKEVSDYFELLLKDSDQATIKYTSSELREKPYLAGIVKALTTIQNRIDSLFNRENEDQRLVDFGDFLYTKVSMVNNTAPNAVDLNKLFATINNSGIQLEQSDIVKANLLKKIKTNKILYGKIWECCENMDDYFERNVMKVFPETEWAKLKKESFSKYDVTVFKYKEVKGDDESSRSGLTIEQISGVRDLYATDRPPENPEEKIFEINCTSILNFSQLLLHTYRIFLKKNGKPDIEGPFQSTRLIEIFKCLEKESETPIMNFIDLLWEVRYVFDSYVVKWITDLDSKERHLELTQVSVSDQGGGKRYFGRNVQGKSEDLMLQSVLYFTSDYLRQYWLTPYLDFLLINKSNDIGELERVDNLLSLTKSKYKEASWALLDRGNELSIDVSSIKTELERSLGTGFRHYWFQKLEYVLWKAWSDRGDEKFKAYRIASKNSIEHIYPQKSEVFLNHDVLHSFGNLVLLSVAQNSEYGKKAVNVKREEFKNKAFYDTLKSFYIFNSYGEVFDKHTILKHRTEMIDLLLSHYSKKLTGNA